MPSSRDPWLRYWKSDVEQAAFADALRRALGLRPYFDPPRNAPPEKFTLPIETGNSHVHRAPGCK